MNSDSLSIQTAQDDATATLIALLKTVKTIALVGASHKPERPSYEVMSFLQHQGFKITPVNPGLAGQDLLNEKVIASVSNLEEAVDMVEIFRNSEAAGQICDEVLKLPESLRPSIVWMQIGVTNETAAEKLQAAGIRIVMDQCPKRILGRLPQNWRESA